MSTARPHATTIVAVKRGGQVAIAGDGQVTLFDKFEQQLEKHQGNLLRAAVGLSREWRTDRYLRHLEAMLLVANSSQLLLLSGDGEIIEPDDDVAAIGSGGPYAHAAARALVQSTELTAPEVARRALEIAASLCIYTNDHITVQTLDTIEPEADADPNQVVGGAVP